MSILLSNRHSKSLKIFIDWSNLMKFIGVTRLLSLSLFEGTKNGLASFDDQDQRFSYAYCAQVCDI